jgi:soluble lytic murein transglycosylase-like protein
VHETEAVLDVGTGLEQNDPRDLATETSLGIRRSVRRWHDRRRGARMASERRHRERRRKRLLTLMLALAAAGIPVALKGPATMALFPGVSVSVEQVRALPPDQAYDDLIRRAARIYSLDEDLIRAVIRAESSFDPLRVSPAGAQGLMQIMPALAKDLGVTDPFDPRQNIMAGARYLRRLLDVHSGNVALALASYNAGPASVARYKGMPPFRETRNYVKKIKGYLAEAEASDTD